MTISQLEQRLLGLQPEQALAEAIDYTKEDYADLNRQQWQEGITSMGADIIPAPYSKEYAEKRRRHGLQTDHIDLYFDGPFYAGYEIDIDGTIMHLTSDVEYEKWVTLRFGEKIWGLTDENMEKYHNIIRPVFMDLIKEQFYG